MMFNLVSFKEGDELFWKEGKELKKGKFKKVLENAKNDKITFGINVETEKGEDDVILNHFIIDKKEYDAIVEKENSKKKRGRKKMAKTVKTTDEVKTVIVETAKAKKAKKVKVETADVAVKEEVIKPTLKGINQILDEGRTLVKGDTYHDYILLDANGETLASFKYRKPVKDLFAAIEADNSTEAIVAYVDSLVAPKKEKKAKKEVEVVEDLEDLTEEAVDELDQEDDDDYADNYTSDDLEDADREDELL